MNEMKPTMAEIAKMMSEILIIAVLFIISLQIYGFILKQPNFNNVVNENMAQTVEYTLKLNIDGQDHVVFYRRMSSDLQKIAVSPIIPETNCEIR